MVVQGLKKGFSAKPHIQAQIQNIHNILNTHNASIIPQWISTRDNVPADTLSRINVGDAHKLNPHVFNEIQRYTNCTIDRFATAANRVMPTFNSYFHEPGCDGVDAFAQTNWQEHVNFCNPPFSTMGKLVKFLHTYDPPQPPTIIIAPRWYQ